MLSKLPAATAGHIEDVKINTFEKLRKKSIIVLEDAIYPPAKPNALAKVPLIISICSDKPF